ncbi:MAG TPA: AI-2E family transporter [Terriglobales bacterium]
MAARHKSEIVLAFAIAVALLLAYVARHVLLLIYVAALFAVVITPLVQQIERLRIFRWHPSRGAAVIIMLLGAVSLAALFSGFALPPIFRDVQQLGTDLPKRIPALIERLESVPILQDYLTAETMQRHAASIAGALVRVLPNLAGAILGFVSVLILTAYFVLDGERAARWGISLFPPEMEDRLGATMLRAKERLRSWLTGQMLLMIILGVLTAVVYGLLGIRYFTVLAVFTGLANIIPIVGPVISVILAASIAAFDSWTKVIGVLAFYAIYQQIENALLTPRIMKATVGLPSLAVIIALAIGGELAGIVGALVAVPSAALVAELAEEYLVKHEPTFPHSEPVQSSR